MDCSLPFHHLAIILTCKNSLLTCKNYCKMVKRGCMLPTKESLTVEFKSEQKRPQSA